MKIGTEVIHYHFEYGQCRATKKRKGVVLDKKVGKLKVKFDDQPHGVWVSEENCERVK